MRARKFELFLQDLSVPTKRQRERLLPVLLPTVKPDQAVDLIACNTADRRACPGCGSQQLNRHGPAGGRQRHRCRDCGRTCTSLTGTPLARLRHKGHWFDYLGLQARFAQRLAHTCDALTQTAP